MNSSRPTAVSRCCAALVAVALAFEPLAVYAAPITTSLLTEIPLQGLNPVKPNIMFTLDDSLSMNNEYLPDYVGELSLTTGFSTVGHCRSTSTGFKPPCGLSPSFTFAADPPYRSDSYNAQYYRASVNWSPGKKPDGSDLPCAGTSAACSGPWTSVYVNGFAGYPGANSGSTANLETGYPDTAWCNALIAGPTPTASELATAFGDGSKCRLNGRVYSQVTSPLGPSDWTTPAIAAGYNYPNSLDVATGLATACGNANEKCIFSTSAAVTGNPYYYTISKVQFCSNKTAGGFGVAPCQDNWDAVYRYVRYGTDAVKAFDPQAFTRVDIKSTGFLVNGVTAANPTGRTYAAEMSNFAKWYAFYRTRILSMKSAAGLAFLALSEDNARVGFHTLWENDVDKGNLFLNVKPFDATQKTSWFNRLYGVVPTGQTPLPDAVYRVGEYFANSGNSGLPGAADPLDPVMGRCQRNYHLLSTDGYWNIPLSGASVGDQDKNVPGSLPGPVPGFTPGSPFPRPYYEGPTASSNSLADLSMRYWINDLRSDFTNNVQDVNAPWQHVTLYGLSIGARGSVDAAGLAAITAGTRDWPAPTGVGATDSIDDLWHAALNSRGKYFNAANPQELAESIVSALTDFVGPNGTGTGIALAGARITNTRNFGYLTSYDSQWTGDLRKYALDTRTGALPADADGNPLNRPVWSAQQQLDLQALGTGWDTARKIVTTDDSKNAVPFRLANLSASQQTSLNAGWAAVTATPPSSQDVLNFLRGDASNEGLGSTNFRKRTHALGDIVYSGAVVVGAPGLPYSDTQPGYTEFVAAKSARTPMVYTGANDGMLHAFIDSASVTDAGKEAWAYIPNVLFHNDDPNRQGTKPATDFQLGALSYHYTGAPLFSHKFYVNATPRVWDVDFAYTNTSSAPADAAHSDWHTMLVGGLGAGGRAVYALDVTTPVSLTDTEADIVSSNRVLWEKSSSDPGFENLGYVFDAPTLVKTRRFGWVALVASGYNNKDGVGKLYVLNPKTGDLLHTFSTGVGTDADPSGLSTIRAFTSSRKDPYALQAYGGDLKGNVWRFDLSDPTSWPTSADLIAKLKDPSGKDQPITTGVRVEIDQNNNVDRYLFVGTGKLLDLPDVNDASVINSLYVIKDGTRTAAGPVPATPYSRADLNAVSGSTVAGFSTPATGRGWYQDALDPKQKITTDVFADVQTVVFAFSKGTDDPCLGDLTSTLYARDFTSGNSVLESGGSVVPSVDIGGVSGIALIQGNTGDVSMQVTTTAVSQASGVGAKGQVFSFGIRMAGGPSLKHRVSWRLISKD